MPLNIFAGAAALLSYCRTCASMLALNFLSRLSMVQVRSIMSSRAMVMVLIHKKAVGCCVATNTFVTRICGI